MRSKLLIVLFGAAAFFCAFFAVTGEASAAMRADVDATNDAVLDLSTTASRAPHANLAQPGSYAAKFGAPLCDDRAASAYAAEPRPAPVDGGEVAASASTSGEECRVTTGAFFKVSAGDPVQRDDLQRTPLPRAISPFCLPRSTPSPARRCRSRCRGHERKTEPAKASVRTTTRRRDRSPGAPDSLLIAAFGQRVVARSLTHAVVRA